MFKVPLGFRDIIVNPCRLFHISYYPALYTELQKAREIQRRRQETGDRRQETSDIGDRGQGPGDRGQETSDRRKSQDTGERDKLQKKQTNT